jgi:hypothetical protein
VPVSIKLSVIAEHSNFEWKLSDDQATELMHRLNLKSTNTLHDSCDFRCRLNYQGFVISSTSQKYLARPLFVHGGIVDEPGSYGDNLSTCNSQLEEWLLDTAGDVVPHKVKQNIRSELSWLWFSYSQYR